MTVRWLSAYPNPVYQVAGFLDDDPFMIGRKIHGIEVLGGLERLDEILERVQVHGIILAGVDPKSPAWESMRALAQQQRCWVRSLRLDFEIVE